MTSSVRQIVKTVLLRVPGGPWLLQHYRALRFYRRWGVRAPKELFAQYYERNSWGDPESLSGPGSTARYTENIRREIPKLIEQFGVRSVLDAPCGDYNWFRLIPLGAKVFYIGGDIVGAMVRRNQQLYGSPNTSFVEFDITRDRLPDVDLWLCRDLLFHLSERDIGRALRNFLRSRIRYLLTSSHPVCEENKDIPTGGFRLLNLQRAPFHFPPPLARMDDWIDGYPVRHLCLWERAPLQEALAANPAMVQVVPRRAARTR